jgi:hypothetical protein
MKDSMDLPLLQRHVCMFRQSKAISCLILAVGSLNVEVIPRAFMQPVPLRSYIGEYRELVSDSSLANQ